MGQIKIKNTTYVFMRITYIILMMTFDAPKINLITVHVSVCEYKV